MEEFVKTIRYYLYRDVFYVLGGISILISASYVFEYINFTFQSNLSTIVYIILFGFAYVVGYLFQEFWALFDLSKTAFPFGRQLRIVKIAHQRLTGKNLIERNEKPNKYPYDIWSKAYEASNRHNFPLVDRLNALKQLGTTMGSSWLTSSLLLLFDIYISHGYRVPDVGVAWTLLSASLFLLLFGRVKAYQEMEAIYQLYSRSRSRTSQSKSKKLRRR